MQNLDTILSEASKKMIALLTLPDVSQSSVSNSAALEPDDVLITMDDEKNITIDEMESNNNVTFPVVLCNICFDPIDDIIRYIDATRSVSGQSNGDIRVITSHLESSVKCSICNSRIHTNCSPQLRDRKSSILLLQYRCNNCLVNNGISSLFGVNILGKEKSQFIDDKILKQDEMDKKEEESVSISTTSLIPIDTSMWGSIKDFDCTEPICFDNTIETLLNLETTKKELESLRENLKNERVSFFQSNPPEFDYIRVCRDLRIKLNSSNIDSPIKRNTNNRGNNDDEAAICVCKKEVENSGKKKSNKLSERGTGCKEDCLNRVSFQECSSRTCVFGKDVEGQCSNRAIQRRENAMTIPMLAMGGKGWGLFADQDIIAGTFIAEYVGDILDETACKERMTFYSRRHAQHYYMLEVRNGFIIDAGLRGNETRFINHSCSANAGAIKMRCRKEGSALSDTLEEEKDVRVGIYALKNIAKGQEITYDYNFVSFGSEKERWTCECGAGNCRKKLGNNKRDLLQDDFDIHFLTQRQSEIQESTSSQVLVPHAGLTFFDDHEAISAHTLALSKSFANSSELFNTPLLNIWMSEPNNKVELEWGQDRRLFLLGKKVSKHNRYDLGFERISSQTSFSQKKGLLRGILNRCEKLESDLQFLSQTNSKNVHFNLKWATHGFAATEFHRHNEASSAIAQPVEETDHSLLQVSNKSGMYINENICSKCLGIGSLLCCDECSRAYHFSCVGKLESDISSSQKWRCPECSSAIRAARAHSSTSNIRILDDDTKRDVHYRLAALQVIANEKN
jgi:SET domain-containing protein